MMSGPEIRVEFKRLAEAVVESLFRDVHCAACGWTLLTAYAVLIDAEAQLEAAWNEAEANQDDDYLIYDLQKAINNIMAARLYDVTDWAMRHRYDEDDTARPTGAASEVWRDGRKTYKSVLDLGEAKREAMRIVDRIYQKPDLDEYELEDLALRWRRRPLTSIASDCGWMADAWMSIARRAFLAGVDLTDDAATAVRGWMADAWMSIARCAFLAGVDPKDDAATAVRGWALHGVVEDAWSWLLEGEDLDCALGEASLLLSDGRLPPPSIKHDD